MRISDWSSDVCSSDLLAVDRALGFSRIGRKGPLPCQFAANAFLKSLPPRIPVAHGRQRIAQPVADRHLLAFIHNERARTAIGSGCLGNEVEHHEGIARPRGAVRQDLEQPRHIERAIIRTGLKGGFQTQNESSKRGTKSEYTKSSSPHIWHV